jgi:hypothetical protein
MIAPKDLTWRKSSHSGGGNTCVEVAALERAGIAVRDSTDTSGPLLAFGRPQWRSFLQEIKRGAFDQP